MISFLKWNRVRAFRRTPPGGQYGGAFDALAEIEITVPRGMRKTATQFGFVENDGVFARLFENGPFSVQCV